MSSLVNDASETLTMAGLENYKERELEQHLKLRAPQTCAEQYRRTTVDSSAAQPTSIEIGAVVPLVSDAQREKQQMRQNW